MLSFLRSLFTTVPPAPLPSPVTITGIRFPANGSEPHTLRLTTTTYGVQDGPDCPWGHVLDLQDFWMTLQGWKWRDFETFRLQKQPLSSCNGLYVVFYSFDSESLPIHSHFPVAIFGRERTFAGDTFVVKLQATKSARKPGRMAGRFGLMCPRTS